MDDETIVILLEIREQVQAIAAMRKVANETKKQTALVASQSKAIDQQNKGLAKQFNLLGAIVRRQAIANNTTQKMQARPGGVTGPATGVIRAQMALRQAQASGDPSQVFNAQYRLQNAQRSMARAQKALYPPPPPNFGQKLWTAVKSSRFSMQGGFHLLPLIGQTMAALGPAGTAIAGIGIAALMATKAFIDLSLHAAEAAVTFTKLGLQAGGNRQQTGELSVYGNALGVDMGSMARQFADAISHNGQAAAFASRAGIHDYGTFDTTNKAEKLLAWVDHLRKLSPTEAMRAARVTGTEDLLTMRGLSDRTMGNLKTDAATRTGVMSEQTTRDMLEMQIAFQRVTFASVSLLVPLVEMVVRSFHVIDALTLLADALNYLARGAAFWAALIQGATANTPQEKIDAGVEIASSLAEWMKAQIDWKNRDKEKHDSAMDRHTRALDDNTYALRNGVFGGGERARGAVPAKWNGMNANRLSGEAARLGAFAL